MVRKKKKPPIILADAEEDLEILAVAIKDVSVAARKMFESRLTKRALILLIHDRISNPKIGKRVIEEVLDAASVLDMTYVKVKK